MPQPKTLRNRRNRPSVVVAVAGCAVAVLLMGGAAAEAAELAPLRMEKSIGASGDLRGRYSKRTLTLAVEVDREGVRLVAYTVKDRPLLRSPEAPPVRTIGQDLQPQVEVVLLGPGNVQYTQRMELSGLCLLHPPGAEPHIAGDTIRLHRDTILMDVPEVAGFDRIEVAFHEGDPYVPERRSLGVRPLDAAHFTPAGGKVGYGELAIASAEAADVGVAAGATSGQVHWPDEYGDSDIYRVEGNEAEMDRRLNITVVPDGYTYADKAVMDSHFDAMVAHFRNKTPYKEHDPFLNYILVYAYSNESGTDQCDCDIIRDTAMATRFTESSPQCGHSDNRCLYYGGGCDTNSSGNIAVAELRAPFPPAQSPDGRVVMVNTTRYGGCGGYRGVYSAAHGSGVEVAVHELGHSLGGLADEYSDDAACGTNADEINTSMNAAVGAWPEWIADIGPPVEGAQYYQQCVYRPENNCEMRSLNAPFCKVCRQHWSLAYFGHPNIAPTAPLEAMSPASPTDAFTQEPTVFSVTTRLAIGATNEFHWTIDGPGYAGPTAVGTNDPTYEHSFTQPGAYTLSCEIIADTNFIKPERFGANVDTALWELNVVDSAVDSDGDSYSPAGGDCNDNNIATYPGAPELCDGENNDCDDPAWPVPLATEVDDDMDGYAECLGDCDDADPERSPGLPEVGCDGIDNDCDPGTSNEVDMDGDTHACDVDCDEGNSDTYPGAPEVNDAEDNQCPGDTGHGFVDEIGPTVGFLSAQGATLLCWGAQAGATDYEVLRSDSVDGSGICTSTEMTVTCWLEPEVPPLGGVYNYLVRSLWPHQGSLGGDPGGGERADVCGTETRCEDSLDNDADNLTDCDDPDCLGIGPCTSVTVEFADTAADDIATTDLQTFFEQVDVQPTDFIRMKLDAGGTNLDWCSARADFYRDQYLALAPTTGSADSGFWEKWSRAGTGAWLGPDYVGHTNGYGDLCGSSHSWCLEPALYGVEMVVSPGGANQCELSLEGIACSDGTWSLTIQVGVNRLAACGF